MCWQLSSSVVTAGRHQLKKQIATSQKKKKKKENGKREKKHQGIKANFRCEERTKKLLCCRSKPHTWSLRCLGEMVWHPKDILRQKKPGLEHSSASKTQREFSPASLARGKFRVGFFHFLLFPLSSWTPSALKPPSPRILFACPSNDFLCASLNGGS